MRIKTLETSYAIAIISLILVLSILSVTQSPSAQVLSISQLTTNQMANWQFFTTGNSSVTGTYQNESRLPYGTLSPSITMNGKFNASGSEIHAVYDFASPLNLTGEKEVLGWLYADGSVGKSTGGFFVAPSWNFSYGIFFFDSTANWKGLRHTPLTWIGWNEIVLPTRFSPNDVSKGWNDSISLTRVKAISIYLQLEAAPDSKDHSLTFTPFQTLRTHPNSAVALIGLYGSVAFVLLLFLSPIIYLGPWYSITRTTRFLARFGQLRPIASTRGAIIFAVAVVVKTGFILVTPLSSDFVNIAYGFAPAFPFSSIFATSIAGGGPWITTMNIFYRLWQAAPVDHPTVLQIFPGMINYPSASNPIFYFLGTPGATLLLLISKSLLLFFDLGIGFLVYAIVLRYSHDEKISLASFAIWLLNPLSNLTGVLWGGVDLIVTFFLLLSIYLIETRRSLPAAVSYGISIGTKLFPIILLPLMVYISMQQPKNPESNKRFGIGSSSLFVLVTSLILVLMILPSLVLGRVSSPIPELGRSPDFTFFYGPIFNVIGIQIGLTPALYVLFLFVIIMGSSGKKLDSLKVLTLGLLVLFAFSRLQPQFMIWLLPFLLISSASLKQIRLFLLFVLVVLAFDLYYFGYYFMTWGNSFFFYPTANAQLHNLANFLATLSYQPLSKLLELDALLGGLFTGFCLGYIYLLSKEQFPNSRLPKNLTNS